ncbi:hypothetical protein ACFL6S_06915 [Candidatus Poribacteria bacterium]
MPKLRLEIQAFVFCILCFFLLYPVSSTVANESLHIAGMGGAFVGLHSAEGGIFGNSAGLTSIQDNNLSIALSAQDLDYESLPLSEDEQSNTWVSFRLTPSVYYSRVIRGIGISLGYVDDVDSRNTIRVPDTVATYTVDERKLVSVTDTVLEYDLFRDQGAVLSLGYPINPRLGIGIKLKYKHRTVKEGVIYRPLELTAVHEEDVNRNDPAKLLPAVIDNLDVGDAIDRFRDGEGSSEDVIADLAGSGLDLDLGMQTKLSDLGGVSAGFVLEHLIQRRIVKPQPTRIRLGIGARPTRWIVTAIDLQKSLDDSGLNVNLGWEVSYKWNRGFSGGIMIRNGFAHESLGGLSSNKTKDKLSIGIGLILGESHWDYTLVKPLDSSSIRKAAHMFSSTVRF